MSAEAASTSMTLNFALPHETIYNGATVASVIIPGSEGEYGVTRDHVPTVAQLKPGVVQVMFDDGVAEKYFCSGGFALTHPNSVTVRRESRILVFLGTQFFFSKPLQFFLFTGHFLPGSNQIG